jgi:hypothetical protein
MASGGHPHGEIIIRSPAKSLIQVKIPFTFRQAAMRAA